MNIKEEQRSFMCIQYILEMTRKHWLACLFSR